MGIESPEQLTVTCDGCDETIEVDVIEYTGDTFGIDDSDLEAEGWTVADGYYCPK